MDLSGVISISGKPGLYKVIAQGKNSIIVESLVDNKRFPAYASDRISALEDISIYTLEGDRPLTEIYTSIREKLGEDQAPSHKEDINILQAFILEFIPDYDEDRVYASDIKKLVQWYNMLLKTGLLTTAAEPEATEEDLVKEEKKESKADHEEKEAAPKKTAAAKKTATAKGESKKAEKE